MTYEKKFIENPILQYEIMKFLEKELDRADLAKIDIQRTPVVTRITLEVMNASRIIGKRSGFIHKLADTLRNRFDIKNPQISVVEVRVPSLEPRIIGRRAAKLLEMGKKPRAILHSLLHAIMSAGAMGAEIRISGAMTKGSRAKSLCVTAGFSPKAGEPARLVQEARVIAVTKFGTIGLLVRIVPPNTVFPGKKTMQIELPKVIKAAELISERNKTG